MLIKKFGYGVFALFLGLVVLFVSVSRAAGEIAAQEENISKSRNSPIEFVVYNNDGTTEPVTYKVPEVSMLPSNPFYGFKKIRDYFWLMFTQGDLKKGKIALLLADKKISETNALIDDGDIKLALEAGSEAIDKLKYADKTISNDTKNEVEVKLVKDSILKAGLAYEKVIQKLEGQFEIDKEKYSNTLNALREFNEQKREEKVQMENQ